LKQADWNEPADIISTFNGADILGKSSDRVYLILEETIIE